jgi:hypothetical protein
VALNVPASAIPNDMESRAALFRTVVADRRVMVILDNSVSAGQILPLLPGGHGCLVLVTSRNRMSGLVSRDGAPGCRRRSAVLRGEPGRARLVPG